MSLYDYFPTNKQSAPRITVNSALLLDLCRSGLRALEDFKSANSDLLTEYESTVDKLNLIKDRASHWLKELHQLPIYRIPTEVAGALLDIFNESKLKDLKARGSFAHPYGLYGVDFNYLERLEEPIKNQIKILNLVGLTIEMTRSEILYIHNVVDEAQDHQKIKERFLAAIKSNEERIEKYKVLLSS